MSEARAPALSLLKRASTPPPSAGPSARTLPPSPPFSFSPPQHALDLVVELEHGDLDLHVLDHPVLVVVDLVENGGRQEAEDGGGDALAMGGGDREVWGYGRRGRQKK